MRAYVLLAAVVLATVTANSRVKIIDEPRSSTSTSSSGCVMNTTMPWRLPYTVVPSAYNLSLTPDLDAFTTSGNIVIDVDVLSATSCIVIHSFNLSLADISLTPTSMGEGESESESERVLSSAPLTPTNITFDMWKQWAILDFGEILPVGAGTLTLSFTGVINNGSESANGFFFSPSDFVFAEDAHVGLGDVRGGRHVGLDEKTSTGSPKGPELHSGIRDAHRRNTRGSTKMSPLPPSFAAKATPHTPLTGVTPTTPTSSSTSTPLSNKYMYTTQFESNAARTAFPCFDEPAYKAYWAATFTVPTGLNVTFNTPEESVTNSGGMSTHVFTQSPVVFSNYLVCFAIGMFDSASATTARGLPVRVLTPLGKGAWGAFAANVTAQAIDLYEVWFNLTYPMPKIDSIAVPAIVMDAMENYGMQTYAPNFLLIEPGATELFPYQMVSLVVCHEVSHQWFGDTVSVPWWSEIFLNEGMARYFQYTCSSAQHPSWNFYTGGGSLNNWFDFVYDFMIEAAPSGASPALAENQASVQTNADISECFTISYPKGASINRMLNWVLGEDAWHAGLGIEIDTHKFTNPNITDYVTSLGMSNGTADGFVDNILPWFTLPGLPVVTVSFDTVSGTVVATQAPSTLYGAPFYSSAEQRSWWIPLPVHVGPTANTTYFPPSPIPYMQPGEVRPAADGGFDFVLDINGFSASTVLPGAPFPDNWTVTADPGFTSAALISYADLDLWVDQLTAATDVSIPTEMRMALTATAMELSLVGVNAMETAIAATDIMLNMQPLDTNATAVVLSYLGPIAAVSAGTDFFDSLSSGICYGLEGMLNATGGLNCSEGEPTYAEQRASALFYAVVFGDPTVTTSAQAVFNTTDNLSTVSPELMPAVFAAGALTCSTEAYNKLYATIAKDGSLADMIYSTLAMFPDETLCNNTLNLAASMGDQFNQATFLVNVLESMFNYNPVCRDTAWATLTAEAPALLADISTAPTFTYPLMNTFTGALGSPNDIAAFKAFVADLGDDAPYVSPLLVDSVLASMSVNEQVQFIN